MVFHGFWVSGISRLLERSQLTYSINNYRPQCIHNIVAHTCPFLLVDGSIVSKLVSSLATIAESYRVRISDTIPNLNLPPIQSRNLQPRLHISHILLDGHCCPPWSPVYIFSAGANAKSSGSKYQHQVPTLHRLQLRPTLCRRESIGVGVRLSSCP